MKKILFTLFLSIICGCSSKPGDAIIKKHIVSFNNEVYNELGVGKLVKTERIKIVNGVSESEKGVLYYTAYVEYDLFFLKEPKDIIYELENIVKSPDKLIKSFSSVGDAVSKISKASEMLQSLLEISIAGKIGKRATLRRTVVLIKGDSGWFVSSSESGWNQLQ